MTKLTTKPDFHAAGDLFRVAVFEGLARSASMMLTTFPLLDGPLLYRQYSRGPAVRLHSISPAPDILALCSQLVQVTIFQNVRVDN